MSAPTPPNMAAPKKKISPVVWILIAVAGLFVILGLVVVGTGIFVYTKAKRAGLDTELIQKNPALAVAKMAVSMNPDVELVSIDEDKGVMTVKEKSTGKILTVNFEDAKSGKFVFSEGDKKVVIGGGDAANTPSWVPVYPGSKAEGVFSAQSGEEGSGGTVVFKTGDSVDAVKKHYEDALKAAGFEIKATMTAGEGATVIAENEAKKRTLHVGINRDGSQTGITVIYSEK